MKKAFHFFFSPACCFFFFYLPLCASWRSAQDTMYAFFSDFLYISCASSDVLCEDTLHQEPTYIFDLQTHCLISFFVFSLIVLSFFAMSCFFFFFVVLSCDDWFALLVRVCCVYVTSLWNTQTLIIFPSFRFVEEKKNHYLSTSGRWRVKKKEKGWEGASSMRRTIGSKSLSLMFFFFFLFSPFLFFTIFFLLFCLLASFLPYYYHYG